MPTYLRDGFPGERLRVLPRPLIRSASERPITRRVLVTDAGYFPHASRHGRSRPDGAEQAIVILCVDGAGWLTLEGSSRRVGTGSAVVIPARHAHSYRADVSDPWSIWWLHVSGSVVPECVGEIVGAADLDPLLEPRDMPAAVAAMDDAVSALERDESLPMLYRASAAAWRLLVNLASDRLRGAPAATDRVEQVQQFLRENLTAHLSVPELAQLVRLSPSHFSALFRASTGYGPIEYVKRLRIARARELLITTERPIMAIAAEVGYLDAFYFARQFRAVNGISAREFRRRSRAETESPE